MSALFLGAADGTIFASDRHDETVVADPEELPYVTDERFAARVITVGDVLPAALLRIATRIAAMDPEALGSSVNGPDIGKVAAEKATSASLEANDTNWTTSVVGTSTDWLDVRGRTLATGAFFTALAAFFAAGAAPTTVAGAAGIATPGISGRRWHAMPRPPRSAYLGLGTEGTIDRPLGIGGTDEPGEVTSASHFA